VDEAEGGACADPDDRGVADAVETCVPCGEQSVDVVAFGERVAGHVLPAVPGDAGADGMLAVQLFHAGAFPAA